MSKKIPKVKTRKNLDWNQELEPDGSTIKSIVLYQVAQDISTTKIARYMRETYDLNITDRKIEYFLERHRGSRKKPGDFF